jgi:hypothetical protein
MQHKPTPSIDGFAAVKQALNADVLVNVRPINSAPGNVRNVWLMVCSAGVQRV